MRDFTTTIEVSDGRGGYAADGFTITVTEQNNPASCSGFTIARKWFCRSGVIHRVPDCSDSDGDAFVFDIYFAWFFKSGKWHQIS